jgi:hypothetical protein
MCSNCGEKPARSVRSGLCGACYGWQRRHGEPRPVGGRPQRLCSVPDCGAGHYANGYCNKHWHRWRRYGSPVGGRRFKFLGDIRGEDFWTLVDRSGGEDSCWPWTHGDNGVGYGRVRHGGESFYAHRLAYENANGLIPDGLEVCHSCDNPPCCNPAHLFLGEHVDNMGDMKAKGRGRGGGPTGDDHWTRMHPERVLRGEATGQSRLTEDDVRAIRARHPSEGLAALAAEFGVDRSMIHRIVKRRAWASVT